MKKITLFGTLLVLSAVAFAAFKAADGIADLNIGDTAPKTNLKMENIDGTQHTLTDLKGEGGLLVIFSCNTCPFVVGNGEKSEGWEGRYNEIHRLAQNYKVGMVLVNSNEAKRTAGDGMADMQARARDYKYTMPYVLDKDHKLADAFGARTTPHVFLFDKDMKLVYKGAIDDNVNKRVEVKDPYLIKAFRAMGSGTPINPATTKELGCSIKRNG